MRKLKYHEQKLLKKVNFYEWKDTNRREVGIMKRYGIADREDYTKYRKLGRMMNTLVQKLRKLPADDKDRIKMTEVLLEKCYSMGLADSTQSLEEIVNISASRFCRRRLASVLVANKFCENIKSAVTWVQQGHFRMGPDVISNPAVHVTREMQDHITWSEGSKIYRHIKEFNDEVDDYELLGN
mmetsp:Transcript_32144/g.74522  ORF Transcript_32144/g.74522 Transcript_32144/m.74522 type:complete len:183 (+) Transcript_32144:77-625(+)